MSQKLLGNKTRVGINLGRSAVSLASIALALVLPAQAQITLTGTNYAQDFNAIASGLPPGWSVLTNASATNLGTAASFNITNITWGATSGQFANYPSTVSNSGTNFSGAETTTIQGNATNRCPAIRQISSFGDPGAAFALQIQDTIGISNLTFSLDLNMLSVQSRSNIWTLDYGVGTSPTTFTPLGTYSDPGTFSSTNQSFILGTETYDQPQKVWIRITALAPTLGSGLRDTFGIDNFVLNFNTSISQTGIPLEIQHLGNAIVLTWANPAFVLQAAPGANGTYTNVPGATSPHTNTIRDTQLYFRLRAN